MKRERKPDCRKGHLHSGVEGDALSELVTRHCAQTIRILEGLPSADIVKLAGTIDHVRRRGGRLFVAGNGGSASTLAHFATDLVMTCAARTRPRMKVSNLYGSIAELTASANDHGFPKAFAARLRQQGGDKDALLLLSTSGQSANLLEAAKAARDMNIQVLAILGMDGGPLLHVADMAVLVRSHVQRAIETTQLAICHSLAELVGRLAESERPVATGRVDAQ